MSNRKRIKAKKNPYKRIGKLATTLFIRLIKWLVRSLLVITRKSRRRSRLSKAGFVLPTVMMVLVVVMLLTTAMMIRSFDRARNASNIRASQAVINAATPALARARVKIEALLKDPALPSGTPSELALYNAIKTNPEYSFGDETRLKLGYDLNQDDVIQTDSENDETLTTAWRFAVDTDNNGKFDSFTLYGIYLRSPSGSNTGDTQDLNQARNPLAARTSPMSAQAVGNRCANILGNGANSVDDSGWNKSGNKLKKSFFVYTASLPITNTSGLGDRFEKFRGNSGFSALEYQRDQSRIPLNNFAAWFDNDLELAPNSDFRLNGRVHTNGNLLVGGHNNALVRFYQVSSKNSCFYQQENGKITVGGNVGNGNVADTSDQRAVEVDLFDDRPDDDNPQVGGTNKSTESAGGSQLAYNDTAYSQRIALMKQAALAYCLEIGKYCSALNPPEISTVLAITRYPEEVKNRFSDRLQNNLSLNTYNVLSEEIELYLKNRTRRVPYSETLASNGDAKGFYNDQNVFANSTTIEPPAEWREPTYDNTNLLLNTRQLEATQPEKQQQDGKETYLGDRILVGNNLPAYWKDGKGYVTAPNDQQLIAGINWTEPDDKPQPRYRSTQVQQVDNSGISDRDGFWEEAAAGNPGDALAKTGGLRIITGAGIYQHKGNPSSSIDALKEDSFLLKRPTNLFDKTKLDSGKDIPTPPEDLKLAGEIARTPYTLVWHDMMPMTGGDDPQTPEVDDEIKAPPDLRMRATALYHYKDTSYTGNSYINRTPTACISSYYDPTSSITARNPEGLPDVSGDLTVTPLPTQPAVDVGRSNNGVVYPAPYTSDTGRFTAIGRYLPELKAQARMMFPNGRIVNEPLQNALNKLNSSGVLADPDKPLSLSENSAIDTTICALAILDDTIQPESNPVIPHGAIREASFLDGREVKALSQDPNSTDYNLELEQRQPIEIRVTEINLDTEETKGITRKEFGTDNDYLLPNSGIIYASRDDALRDDSEVVGNNSNTLGARSNTLSGDDRTNESKLLSPTDFKLDSTRRPNGIRLINGSNLSRTEENTYREAEKGLTLATNLPVYVQGDFNLHQTPGGNKLEEFLETLVFPNWSNFYTRADDLNPNFACRPGRSGCPTNDGDTWRPATIISDSITLLSNRFKDGFRDRGDFDLRNNAGIGFLGYDFNTSGQIDEINETQDSIDLNDDGDTDDTISERDISEIKYLRKRKGFFDNNFVTSALWSDTNSSGNPYPNQKTNDDNVGGSYLTNGVTPIQRRANFPEYVMEICRKIPVDTCDDSSDWVVGYDGIGNDPPDGKLEGNELTITAANLTGINKPEGAKAERLGSGTTARPALRPEDQRYARRVAFRLNSTSGSNPQNSNPQNGNPQNGNQPGSNQPSSNQPSGNQPSGNQPGNSQGSPSGNFNLIISQNINPDGNQQDSNQPGGNQPSGNQPNGNQPSGNQPGGNQPGGNPSPNPSPNPNQNLPTPLGIDNQGKVQEFPYDGRNGRPRQVPNALWFKTTDNPGDPTQGNTYSATNPLFLKQRPNSNQPLLVPVLQIHSSDGSPGDSLDRGSQDRYATNWLQTAGTDTTFNATFISGNSSGRSQEESAGLQNFVRFLENWQDKRVTINGNFIQMWRSAYATAPFGTILRNTVTAGATATNNLSLFDYPINNYWTNNGTPAGTLPYYGDPIRQWGFDVGLLSQSPDLFAQTFTAPSTNSPNEFFREVDRDDPWIQTLLCAATASDRVGTSTATYSEYAVPDKNQRPATCRDDAPNYPANDPSQQSN